MGTLFNAFLLLLWLRIVPVSREEAVGNPLVSVPLNQADRIADLVRPAFGSHASRPFGAVVILAVALVLRAGVAYATKSPGFISVGSIGFSPPAATATPLDCLVFSVLSFAWTIERLWMLVLVFGWMRRNRQPDMEDGLAQSLGRPVSDAPRWLQLLLVTLLSIVLSHATIRTGYSHPFSEMVASMPEEVSASTAKAFQVFADIFPDFRSPTPLALALMLAGSFAEVFAVSADVVMALIMAAFIGLIFRLTYWLALGNAGLSYIVGSFFRSPMRAAGMSFAPLLYLLLAGVLYFVSLNILFLLALGVTGSFTPELLDSVREVLEMPVP